MRSAGLRGACTAAPAALQTRVRLSAQTNACTRSRPSLATGWQEARLSKLAAAGKAAVADSQGRVFWKTTTAAMRGFTSRWVGWAAGRGGGVLRHRASTAPAAEHSPRSLGLHVEQPRAAPLHLPPPRDHDAAALAATGRAGWGVFDTYALTRPLLDLPRPPLWDLVHFEGAGGPLLASRSSL